MFRRLFHPSEEKQKEERPGGVSKPQPIAGTGNDYGEAVSVKKSKRSYIFAAVRRVLGIGGGADGGAEGVNSARRQSAAQASSVSINVLPRLQPQLQRIDIESEHLYETYTVFSIKSLSLPFPAVSLSYFIHFLCLMGRSFSPTADRPLVTSSASQLCLTGPCQSKFLYAWWHVCFSRQFLKTRTSPNLLNQIPSHHAWS